MATWGDIINYALGEINALTPGAASNANDTALGLAYVSALADQWNAESLMQFVIRLDSYTFGAVHTDGIYTIGPSGADFADERPVDILDADIGIVSGGQTIWYPLKVIDAEEYEQIPILEIGTSIPQYLWYEPDFPNGKIHLWTYPTNASYFLRLRTNQQIARPGTLSTAFSFPPGYEKAFRLNLAADLLNPFGKTGEVAARVIAQAAAAKAVIVGPNSQAPKLTFDHTVQSTQRQRLYNYTIGPLS